MISDYEMLKAISKGSFWLKLKKLRALGFIEGRLPLKLRTTPDGEQEIARLERGQFEFPITDATEFHTLKRALDRQAEDLARLEFSDLGIEAKAMFKRDLDRVNVLRARLETFATEALKS